MWTQQATGLTVAGGGVTAAVAANVEMLLVARHENWTSDAVFLYVSDSHKRKLIVSRAILGGK